MGTPVLWSTLHNPEGKNIKIFRFGPILLRIEKNENTETPKPHCASADEA